MKERSTRTISRRLRRIEDLLNPSPNTHKVTPEMQELYDRIMMKGQEPKEQTETAGED
jgi:hypothetical protein